jgi:hypothetical protein
MQRASEITDVSVASHPEYRFPILDVPILSFSISARNFLRFLSARLITVAQHEALQFQHARNILVS